MALIASTVRSVTINVTARVLEFYIAILLMKKMKTTLLSRTAKESSGLHALYNDKGEIQVVL
jgi:hypothetical protein